MQLSLSLEGAEEVEMPEDDLRREIEALVREEFDAVAREFRMPLDTFAKLNDAGVIV